ncbi:LOW QUALITY PROTEIN: hypothetical protein ElyMa_003319500 [Elysia marginata]|uniref:Uncharacterized protein n=1 Tax=Elysia marginata TaxID=1093978 RepID=A0AAV4JEA0_9GAST|nr:LOW QUALITY PROTEIN: hypothetical protein ElyMa_003319500 [Elysia marginata]
MLITNTKVTVYRVLVFNTLLHCSDNAALYSLHEVRHKTTHLHRLIYIMGISRQDCFPKKKSLEKWAVQSVFVKLSQKRLRVLEHTSRIQDERTAKVSSLQTLDHLEGLFSDSKTFLICYRGQQHRRMRNHSCAPQLQSKQASKWLGRSQGEMQQCTRQMTASAPTVPDAALICDFIFATSYTCNLSWAKGKDHQRDPSRSRVILSRWPQAVLFCSHIRLQVSLPCVPLAASFRIPCWFQNRACLVIFCAGFHSLWHIHLYFSLCISVVAGFWSVCSLKYVLLIFLLNKSVK